MLIFSGLFYFFKIFCFNKTKSKTCTASSPFISLHCPCCCVSSCFRSRCRNRHTPCQQCCNGKRNPHFFHKKSSSMMALLTECIDKRKTRDSLYRKPLFSIDHTEISPMVRPSRMDPAICPIEYRSGYHKFSARLVQSDCY